MYFPYHAQTPVLQDRGWSSVISAKRYLGSSQAMLDTKNKDLSEKASSRLSRLPDAKPPNNDSGRLGLRRLSTRRSAHLGRIVKLSQRTGTSSKRLLRKGDSTITKVSSASKSHHHSDRAPYPLDNRASSALSRKLSAEINFNLSGKRSDRQGSKPLKKSPRKSKKLSSSSKQSLYTRSSLPHSSSPQSISSPSSLSPPSSSSTSNSSGSPSEPSGLLSTPPSLPNFPTSLMAQIYHDIHVASAPVIDEVQNRSTEFLDQKRNTSGGLHAALMLHLSSTYQVIGKPPSLSNRVSSLT